MTSKDLIKLLKQDGWYIVRSRGSHMIMKNDKKPGRLTVPVHNGDLKPGTLNAILKDAGLK